MGLRACRGVNGRRAAFFGSRGQPRAFRLQECLRSDRFSPRLFAGRGCAHFLAPALKRGRAQRMWAKLLRDAEPGVSAKKEGDLPWTAADSRLAPKSSRGVAAARRLCLYQPLTPQRKGQGRRAGQRRPKLFLVTRTPARASRQRRSCLGCQALA